MYRKLYLILLFVISISILIISEIPVNSLPLYTARSGRICDNCHITPYKTDKQDEWPNPRLAARKCNVSCLACHINPGGGGVRNVVGRFYAQNTLPMFAALQRPYHDKDRTFSNLFSSKPASAGGDGKKESTSSTSKGEYSFSDNKNAKRNIEEHHKPHGFYPADFLAFGYPLNAATIEEQSEYAFNRERYGMLNSDPIFMLGTDIRPTLLVRRSKAHFIPMQADIGFALHPIEHLTISGTGGVTKERLPNDENIIAKLQNAFVMIHELPYMTYIQGGFFIPSYGVRHDDHTAPGRQQLEMSHLQDKNIPLGVEIGLAVNYPYLTVSFFTNRMIEDNYSFHGWGTAVTAGWRDLAWGAGLSFIKKERTLEEGGNLIAGGYNGYFNLGRIMLDVPLVLQLEINVGQKPKTMTEDKVFLTTMAQLDYLLVNGVDIKMSHHYYKDDLKNTLEEYQMLVWGFDYTIVYNVKLTGEYRYTIPSTMPALSERSTTGDFLLFFHFYL
ncbi:MAG: hypothetical protein OEZ36_14695 [Spirochaetota bacterium]|nr:hypothetical protein [Spirochaetota bacterium]